MSAIRPAESWNGARRLAVERRVASPACRGCRCPRSMRRHQRIGLLQHPHQAHLVRRAAAHHLAQVGGRLPQVGAAMPGRVAGRPPARCRRPWPSRAAPRVLERQATPRSVRGRGHVAGSRGRCGWSARRRTRTSRREICGQVLHALLQVLERGAVERLLDPLGDVADVAGDAAGLRGELADVGERRAGPRLAAGRVATRLSASRRLGSSGSSSSETMFALHSPKRLTDAAIDGRVAAAARRCGRAACRPPPTRSAARRIASTRPTFTPRSVTGAPTPSPPTVAEPRAA